MKLQDFSGLIKLVSVMQEVIN